MILGVLQPTHSMSLPLTNAKQYSGVRYSVILCFDNKEELETRNIDSGINVLGMHISILVRIRSVLSEVDLLVVSALCFVTRVWKHVWTHFGCQQAQR